MTIPMGEVPRKLRKLDEDFTSLCADVSTIKLIQAVHGEWITLMKGDIVELKADVGTLKTDIGTLKTEVNGKLDVILSRLPER